VAVYPPAIDAVNVNCVVGPAVGATPPLQFVPTLQLPLTALVQLCACAVDATLKTMRDNIHDHN
jgi:hypothetical protein